jgi:hypothetical protein
MSKNEEVELRIRWNKMVPSRIYPFSELACSPASCYFNRKYPYAHARRGHGAVRMHESRPILSLQKPRGRDKDHHL